MVFTWHQQLLCLPLEFLIVPLQMTCCGWLNCVDVILSSWPDEVDSSGVKVRNISYTLSLTNPLGPKTSPSTERQVFLIVFQSFFCFGVLFLIVFRVSFLLCCIV